MLLRPLPGDFHLEGHSVCDSGEYLLWGWSLPRQHCRVGWVGLLLLAELPEVVSPVQLPADGCFADATISPGNLQQSHTGLEKNFVCRSLSALPDSWFAGISSPW